MNDSEIRTTYHTQGYVMLRNLYSREEMNTWKQKALTAQESGERNFGVHVWMLDTMPDFFRDRFCAAELADPIQAIYEGQPVELLSAKPVFKSGRMREASPWHQDNAYWRGASKLSVWIALDQATPENGCLRVVKGGHQQIIEHHQADGAGFGNRLTEEMLPPGEIVDCVMEAGDALIFHDLLPHSSYPNTSGADRWSMIPTYRSASTADESTTWQAGLRL